MANPFDQFDASDAPDYDALEEKHGLPKGLLTALRTTEGSGKNAVSPKGAVGEFQFMPATARAYGLDDPTDTGKAAEAAARYMADAMKRYGTSDPKVLAAEYNGGPTQAKAVLAGKVPPALETQKYIQNVSAAMPSSANPFDRFDNAKPVIPAAAKQSAQAPTQAAISLTEPVLEAVGNMASGAVAKPIGDLAGLGAIAAHYLGLTDKLPEDVKRQVQEALTYEPKTAAGQKIAQYNPLALAGRGWGMIADAAGNAVFPPDSPLNPLGAGLAEGIKQLPMALAGPGAKATGSVMEGGAQRLMQSALKPDLKELQTGQAASAINTLLDEGINVSRGGAQRLTDRVDALNTKISDLIQNSPATVNRDLVSSRLQDTVTRFAKQVNPMTDLVAIQKAYDEFQTTWPQQIPVQLAQEMKQGTYRELRGKYLGELGSANIESQKALARGLKEEIANMVPDVVPLNAAESRLLNALPLVERRVMMDANKNPAGLGILSTNPTHFAMWMADKSALFKSLIARMMNAGGDMAQAVAPVGGLAGEMTNEQQQRKR